MSIIELKGAAIHNWGVKRITDDTVERIMRLFSQPQIDWSQADPVMLQKLEVFNTALADLGMYVDTSHQRYLDEHASEVE